MRQRTILLIEDSPEDREVILRAFEKLGVGHEIRCCDSGVQALDFLHRRGVFQDPAAAPRPGLVLLDLNLPGVDGQQVLESLKRDPELSPIPVVVLSSSAERADVRRCYAAGASGYVQKPLGVEQFALVVRRLKEFWFDLVELPEP